MPRLQPFWQQRGECRSHLRIESVASRGLFDGPHPIGPRCRAVARVTRAALDQVAPRQRAGQVCLYRRGCWTHCLQPATATISRILSEMRAGRTGDAGADEGVVGQVSARRHRAGVSCIAGTTTTRAGCPPSARSSEMERFMGPSIPWWNWHKEGFRFPPTPRRARPGECVYRIWGGTSLMRGSRLGRGVFFTDVAPFTRWEAEKLLAVFEWGNTCERVTAFRLPTSAVLWVGRVHPGDPRAVLGAHGGTQILIENPLAQSLVPLWTRPLRNDLGAWRLHPAPRWNV